MTVKGETPTKVASATVPEAEIVSADESASVNGRRKGTENASESHETGRRRGGNEIEMEKEEGKETGEDGIRF